MPQIWTILDISVPLTDIPEQVRRIEALGYDGVALPDIIHDGIAAATLAISATERIQIASSALTVFPRSPMIVAVAAWDLQQLSGGRYTLALGTQIRGNIVDRYSTEWTAPAPRMREYAQSLRAIFDCWQHGKPLRFEGEHYHFTRMQPFTSPPPIEHPDIPIRLAGIGPNMTALAGELAQGINTHPTNVSPRFVREHLRPHLARGAERVGRDPSEISIWLNPMCATGRDDAAVRSHREEQRAMLATLYSTPPYWHDLTLHGWRDVGETSNQWVREGRWEELASLVTDEMLEVFLPTAAYAELPTVLTERYAGLGDAISFPVPADPADDAEAARAIATLRGAW